jgi:hypothetical protein
MVGKWLHILFAQLPVGVVSSAGWGLGLLLELEIVGSMLKGEGQGELGRRFGRNLWGGAQLEVKDLQEQELVRQHSTL